MNDDEGAISITKAELKSLINTVTTKTFDKVWTLVSANAKVDYEHFDMKTQLKSKLIHKMDSDLQLNFPEFATLRKEVLIRSFLSNHAQDYHPDSTYNTDEILELKSQDAEIDRITLTADIDEENKSIFITVMEGCVSKRKDRRNVGSVPASDENQYRKKFLKFLSVCESRSGKYYMMFDQIFYFLIIIQLLIIICK
jgi:hypothetical protein